MPLRASVNGVEVLATALSEAEWDALRERVMAEGLRVILPCCGAEGFLRRNHLGTQHFAHKPGANACEMEGETIQHLSAKAEIVRACHASAYQASTEIPGEGWRADVLAWRGKARIAFEVQWSFLRLDECEFRQTRYAQTGVRGCWFFRKPPPALVRGGRTGPALKARQDLPLFHLIASVDNHFAVELNGTQQSLGAFVRRLLEGGIRYCENVTATQTQAAEIVLFECPCTRCGYRSVVYAVDPLVRADCGLLVSAPGSEAETLLVDAHIVAAVANYREMAAGRALRLGDVKLRDGRMSQGCARCDRAFAPREILDEYAAQRRNAQADQAAWLGQWEVALPLRSALTMPIAHWCCPADGVSFCC
jgi:hypothetical protein